MTQASVLENYGSGHFGSITGRDSMSKHSLSWVLRPQKCDLVFVEEGERVIAASY